MKRFILAYLLAMYAVAANAQSTKKPTRLTNKAVDIACGECQFKMPTAGKGKDCNLAIRLDGKTYFVDGKGIDDFGDAHDKHGFCNAISQAKVSGEIVNNRFKAKSIELIKPKH